MKKLLITAVLLTSLMGFSQEKKVEEKKWRTLTVSSLSGLTFTGKYLQTVSMALDYELKNKFSIASWCGANYNYSYNGGWISGQVTLNKKLNKYNIGAGIMYGSGNLYTPLPDNIMGKDVSGIITVSRRFKLN
jgi:opacity protein-like surface antigen